MQLLLDVFPDRPAFDMAVSHALLQRVATGELPPTLRVHSHGRAVILGKLDRLAPGYGRALAAARAHGYEPVQRLAGGRAAVYHEGTVTIGEAVADPDANVHVHSRYAEAAARIAAALRSVGVDARVGEIPGEYCAGAYSVNARGARKLTGTGQRVVRGGAYVGTVVAVTGAARINAVLHDVYPALGLPFDPSATGAVEDEAPGITVADVTRAIVRAHGDPEPAALDAATLALAAELEPLYRTDAPARGARV